MDRPTLTWSGPRASVHPEASGLSRPLPQPQPVLLRENPVPLGIDTLCLCPGVGPSCPLQLSPLAYEYAVPSLSGGQTWAASLLALQVGSELFGQEILGAGHPEQVLKGACPRGPGRWTLRPRERGVVRGGPQRDFEMRPMGRVGCCRAGQRPGRTRYTQWCHD